MLAAGAFFALGVWAVVFRESLSPVYSDVTCKLLPPKLESFQFSVASGVSLDLVSTTVCDNPNPYAVILDSTEAVQVLLGDEKTPVATVTNIPLTELPARGTGSIDAHVSWSPPTSEVAQALVAALGVGPVPIYVPTHINLRIDINFFFTRVKMAAAFNKQCGFNVQPRLLGAPQVGPFACADSLEELHLPAADAPFNGELPLYSANLAEKEVEAGTLAKDIGLGLAIATGFGIGAILLFFGLFACVEALNLYRAAGCARDLAAFPPSSDGGVLKARAAPRGSGAAVTMGGGAQASLKCEV